MWVNPKYRDQSEPPAPPAETGERLATFPRQGGEELRVSLDTFNGHPFISLRLWAPGRDGQLWPVRGKGCSIRIREVADLVEALQGVVNTLDRRPTSQERPHRTPAAPGVRSHDAALRRATEPRRRSVDAGSLNLDNSEGFDEFGG